MAFTFLNVTGAPELSRSDARRMRAHITKTNFANRRERLKRPDVEERRSPAKHVAIRRDASLGGLLLSSPPNDRLRFVQYLSRFWSLVMVYDSPFPATPDEGEYLRIIASEESLAEVSLAIGMRHWSPDPQVQRKAVAHSSKASAALIRRIQSRTAHMAPVLFAVLSMAIGARLTDSSDVWNIHVDGLADIITERRKLGETEVPALLRAFLVIDSINHISGFTLGYHRKVIDAIRPYGDRVMGDVADICEAIILFRRAVDVHIHSSFHPDAWTRLLQPHRNRLLQRARDLRARYSCDIYVRAASLAMELVLYLSAPRSQQDEDLTPLASQLRDAISAYPVRGCIFMDLASSQLMLGAVAASEGSEVKDWFVMRKRRAVQTLQARGWERPLEVVDAGMAADDPLVARFREVWREVDS